jgi:predicted metal-dependent hydrolase
VATFTGTGGRFGPEYARVISIRRMNNKWASYTQRNDLLIFNAELLDMDKKVGDYVMVHELLHFAVPNHGKLWKSLMRAYLGDYEKVELRLRRIREENDNSFNSRRTKKLKPSH